MASGDTPTKEQIVTMYNRLSSEIREIQTKLFEIDTKMEEHELVAGALEPLPPERKCFRLIGGVLVERTVAQVLPVVRDNAKQLRGVSFSSDECLPLQCRMHQPEHLGVACSSHFAADTLGVSLPWYLASPCPCLGGIELGTERQHPLNFIVLSLQVCKKWIIWLF
jgi:hypothetical protein